MRFFIAEDYLKYKSQIIEFITDFNGAGNALDVNARNSIKLFELDGKTINIKAFRKPNLINRVVYRFFRKSKAERSFEYAGYLLKRNIGTPQPVGYAEELTSGQFLRSYYVSEHLDYDLTFRDIDLNTEGHKEILKAFSRFTFKLHENGVEFLDHSPGNTLIILSEPEPKFYLVDLNRMNFRKLNFEARMKNFSRLTPKKEMVEVMASEYAKLIDRPEIEVFEKMWFYTESFQKKFMRKHRLKKKLGLRK